MQVRSLLMPVSLLHKHFRSYICVGQIVSGESKILGWELRDADLLFRRFL
jgi:hypothetical protein